MYRSKPHALLIKIIVTFLVIVSDESRGEIFENSGLLFEFEALFQQSGNRSSHLLIKLKMLRKLRIAIGNSI